MSGFGMVLAMRYAEKCDNNNELLTLLAIANFTDGNGRGCYASRQTLADQVLISRETVKRCIPRLAAKGLIAPGDLALVAHMRNDRRTEVWDLAGAKDPDRTGGHRDPSVVNDGSNDHPTGGQTITPRGVTVTPKPVIEEPVKNEPPLLTPQRTLRSAQLGLTEDEETKLIEWANRDNRKGPGWWRKVAAEGDLPTLVADWRAAQTSGADPGSFVMPPHCGACHPKTRMIEPGEGQPYRCPECHPSTPRHPSQPRPSATDRAIAEVSAATAAAKRTLAAMQAGGHQPYRNPADQSVYLEPIA